MLRLADTHADRVIEAGDLATDVGREVTGLLEATPVRAACLGHYLESLTSERPDMPALFVVKGRSGV